MNWNDAVAAMRTGCHVRQLSQMYMREIDVGLLECTNPDPDSIAQARVYEVGTSGYKFAAGLTDSGCAVLVFVNPQSDRLLVPTTEQQSACDWVVVATSHVGDDNAQEGFD